MALKTSIFAKLGFVSFSSATVFAVASPSRLNKSLATSCALMILPPLVPLHVNPQASSLHEHLGAASALELFHASMLSFVIFSGNSRAESFVAALSALVRLLARVQGHVVLKFLFLVVLLVALVAGKYISGYLMFILNMYFERRPIYKSFLAVLTCII